MNTEKDKIKYEQSAMAVVLCKGKILCTVEIIYGKPTLSLPKGHVEEGETVIDAAIRECYEETGVKLCQEAAIKQLEPYSYTFTTPNGQIVCKTLSPVLFHLNREQTPIAKEKRILEAKFADVNEFLRECAYENVVNLVKNCL